MTDEAHKGEQGEWCPCYAEQQQSVGVHCWDQCLCTRQGCQHVRRDSNPMSRSTLDKLDGPCDAE